MRGEKSGPESTEIVQEYILYVHGRGSNVPAAQNFFPFPSISSHSGNTDLSVTAIWNVVLLQSTVLGTQSQEHVLHFHLHHQQTFIKQQTFQRPSDEKVPGTGMGCSLKCKWVLQFINLVIWMIKKVL